MPNSQMRTFCSEIAISLYKRVIAYALILALSGLSPLLVIPILLTSMDTAEYGRLNQLILFSQYVNVLIAFSSQGLIQNIFAKCDNWKKSFIEVEVVLSINAIAVILLLTLASQLTLVQFTFQETLLVGICALMMSAYAVAIAILQISKKVAVYVKSQVAFILSNILLTYILVSVISGGLEGRLLAIVIAYVLIVLPLSRIFTIDYSFRNQPIRLGYIYKWGWSLLPHAVSAIIFTSLDRLFLQSTLSAEQFGVYSLHFQLIMPLLIVGPAINQALKPDFFEACHIQNLNRALILILGQVMVLGLLTMIYFVTVLEIIDFFGGKIFTIVIDKSVLVLMAILVLFQLLYYPVSNVFFFYKKTKILSFHTVAACLVTSLSIFVFGDLVHSNVILKFVIFGTAIYTATLFFVSLKTLRNECEGIS